MELVFALVSDLHFGREAGYDGKLRKLTAQAPRLTRAFVDRMNDVIHPELVVNLGDDIEDENRDADLVRYGECMGELARCNAEVRHVAGNHDLINLTEDDLTSVKKQLDELMAKRKAEIDHLAKTKEQEILKV